jgi:diguanylate cyclase (GGDEF)-like protein
MKVGNFSIFDSFLYPVLLASKDQRLLYTNPAFANLLEYSLKRLKLGAALSEVVGDNAAHFSMAAKRPSISHEVKLLSGAGQGLVVQLCAEKIQLENEEAYLFAVHDVSIEHRLQQKYRLELQQKEMFIRKLDRKLFEVSFLLEISTGINRQGGASEIIVWALELIAERFHFKSTAFLQVSGSSVTVVATSGEPQSQEFWEKAAQDPEHKDFVHVSYSKVKDTVGIVAFVKKQDLTAEDMELLKSASVQVIARLERELLYSSSVTDEKTGLYNARFLRAALEKEVRRSLRGNEPFGFIVIDIDHFKKFNDTYGHQTGDEVLAHVAKLILAGVRDVDVAARFGGEEFCVIAVKSSREGLLVVMERIRHSIEATKCQTKDHGPLSVTASLGGTMFINGEPSAEKLFEIADIALYEAKANGRNRCVIK